MRKTNDRFEFIDSLSVQVEAITTVLLFFILTSESKTGARDAYFPSIDGNKLTSTEVFSVLHRTPHNHLGPEHNFTGAVPSASSSISYRVLRRFPSKTSKELLGLMDQTMGGDSVVEACCGICCEFFFFFFLGKFPSTKRILPHSFTFPGFQHSPMVRGQRFGLLRVNPGLP